MNKKQRQSKIIEIIKNNEISTQEELTGYLTEHGYDVTQATVSRDINELNLIKIEGRTKKQRYIISNHEEESLPANMITMFSNMLVSMACANNLIILKTLSGSGNSVAMIVDKMNLPQILGTIAGDDAVLIVTKTNKEAEYIIRRFKEIIK